LNSTSMICATLVRREALIGRADRECMINQF
jgi:hypothetical protein